MARSLVNRSLVAAGLAAVLGCAGSAKPGGTTGGGASPAGSTGTGGSTGTQTTSSSSSSSSGSGTTSSSTSSSSTTGSGATGTGGGGTGSSSGSGGAGSMSGSSSGSGGSVGTGGMGTGGADPANVDADGDGWTVGEGDCCDTSANCTHPELVNPGAFEYPGNGIDDDCDPSTPDNAPAMPCSAAQIYPEGSSDDLIMAMDLCQFTTENAAKPVRKWGVISTELLLADGTTALPMNNAAPPMTSLQVGVLANYGANVFPIGHANDPTANPTMASLSSGTACDPSESPLYVHPKDGKVAGQTGSYNAMTQATIQASYLQSHNGKPPSPATCPVCTSGCDQAYDSVDLKARIRVPTNAMSFTYSLKFYSAEFPEYLCKQYNDFFITLLTSSWVPNPQAVPPQQPLPADGNIAFDALGNPISVNNAFFDVCFVPPSPPPGITCPAGQLELVGTGMGGWGNDLTDGGGTVWLKNDAPVQPGETIEIQFITWDAGDHNVDSLVLLDKFHWNITPASVSVHK
jgi:hypothetical protein